MKNLKLENLLRIAALIGNKANVNYEQLQQVSIVLIKLDKLAMSLGKRYDDQDFGERTQWLENKAVELGKSVNVNVSFGREMETTLFLDINGYRESIP